MKYIIFLSKDIWPAINSFCAYIKLKKEYPENILILYSSSNEEILEKRIKDIYRLISKNVQIRKIKIDENVDTLKNLIESIVDEGDIIDITGARKSMILAFMHLKNLKIVYLHLKDMRFSQRKFMMRPMALQKWVEVEI